MIDTNRIKRFIIIFMNQIIHIQIFKENTINLKIAILKKGNIITIITYLINLTQKLIS